MPSERCGGTEWNIRERPQVSGLERDSQAKRQSRSPRSKVERVDIPGDAAQRAEVSFRLIQLKVMEIYLSCLNKIQNLFKKRVIHNI